jgi:hypothetical protein
MALGVRRQTGLLAGGSQDLGGPGRRRSRACSPDDGRAERPPATIATPQDPIRAAPCMASMTTLPPTRRSASGDLGRPVNGEEPAGGDQASRVQTPGAVLPAQGHAAPRASRRHARPEAGSGSPPDRGCLPFAADPVDRQER